MSMLLPSLTELGAWKIAVGATLSTVTVAVYSVAPPSLSRIVPLTVRVSLSSVGQFAVAVAPNGPYPEPQSNAYSKPALVSALDGSNGAVSVSAISDPSSTGVEASNVAVGATLLIATVAVYSVVPPSLSRIVPLTVREPLSVVGQLAVLVALNAP